ncbi:MAG: ComF family protein [Bacteroidales bacterium]|nr:ComF family protein [Bacteroidales bacterium]
MCRKIFITLRYWISALRNLIFPRKCIVCDALLDEDEQFLCGDCRFDIPLTYFWFWSDNPAKLRVSRFFPVTDVVALFFYRHESGYADILHKIKYEGNIRLGHEMGRLLGKEMAESGNFSDIQAIVPVPLHFARRFRRGYNQAEIIAGGVARELGIPVLTDLLIRKHRTKTQVKLSPNERFANVAQAFCVNQKALARYRQKGISHIIIFDDVLTTGATIAAAAAPLTASFEITAVSLAAVE